MTARARSQTAPTAPLNVRFEWLVHPPAMLERHQDNVGRDRGTAENVYPNRIRDRIHHGTIAGSNWRLARSARAYRGFGIGQIDRVPIHRRWNVQYGQRLVVMKPLRERHAIVLVVDHLLKERMPDAKTTSSVQLAAEAAGIDDRADIAHGKVIDERCLAGLDVDFDFRKSDDERPCRTVARIVILCNSHQSKSGQFLRRAFRKIVNVLGKLVTIVLSAQRNRPRA